MTETKMALMTRLRAEGRWEEADKFREETRARLRAEEMCRNEAREEAWRLTAETYPPRRVERQSPRVNAPRIEEVNAGVILEPSEDERRELVELAQTPGAWKGNLTEALRWAKTNWELDVTPSQARSVLEWLLWKLCSEIGRASCRERV